MTGFATSQVQRPTAGSPTLGGPGDAVPPRQTSAAASPRTQAAPSPEQMQAIAQARRQGRRISRAAGIAAFSGWTMAFFAIITLICGFFSIPAFLLGAGLAVVASLELRGSKGLRRLDLSAPRRLGFNQIALSVMLIAYGGWGILSALTAASPYEAQLAAGGAVAEALEPIDRLQRALTVLFYTAVIGFSVLTQGCLSAYYFTRRRHLASYLSKTPPWIVDMLRVAAD
jgi:hypothetical protein